jgi:hypothetical protein
LFRTGVDGLDVALGGGLGPGVHVFLARHSAGSTTLALQVTEGAIGKGLPVLLVGDIDFLRGAPRRLAALRAGIGLHPDGSIRDAPEGIHDAWACAANGLVSCLSTVTASNQADSDVVRQEVEQRRPALVVIDGVQPVQMVVAERGASLLAAARFITENRGIPVIVTGHLSSRLPRQVFEVAGRRPTMGDVGEHRGLFECSADTLVLMNRSSVDLYNDSTGNPEGVLATLVRRHEAVLEADFTWSRMATRFV